MSQDVLYPFNCHPFCGSYASGNKGKIPRTCKCWDVPVIPKLLQKNFLIEQESLSFWQADLPNPQMLLPESNRWIYLWKLRISGELPATLIETLRATDKDCFPNIHTLLMIGCVLPTSSATAERSFSLLRRLKTHLRSTMSDKRLSGLTLMSSHYSVPINIDAVANHFAQMHPRRMFMRSAILVEDLTHS